MDTKKAVRDLVLEAFQDAEIQDMFGNLTTHCQQREGVADDKLRDLLLDLVVESYMLSNCRQKVTIEQDEAGGRCDGLEASSNDSNTITEVRLQQQGVHNTNISNNTQKSVPTACQENYKENAEITNHVYDRKDYPENTSSDHGSLYKRVLSALRLAKKENVTTIDGHYTLQSNVSEHIPCEPTTTISDHDDELRRVWMRLSDPAPDTINAHEEGNTELTTTREEIDINLTTHQGILPGGTREGFIFDDEPSLMLKTMDETHETIDDQHLVRESDRESNLDEYESASDIDDELESWHSNEEISLSRASSSSFLTASDYLDDVCADPIEEVILTKTIRPQFLGKYYLQRLANARQTAAEVKARKPEPRVKLDKPCRLDTNLTYAVRQSLKRSLPLIAGKNKLSALMMVADGMYDEMSLDRDLDDLAWPFDPLAELRKSGLAMVDYMEPHPAGSATMITSDMKETASQSDLFTCSTSVQDKSDLKSEDFQNNIDNDLVETLELSDSFISTPTVSSNQPTNASVSEVVDVGSSVPTLPRLGTVSNVSKGSFQNVTPGFFLFKPLKSVVNSFFDRDSFKSLANRIQSSPTYEISKIKLLPLYYSNTRHTSLALLPDEHNKLQLSLCDESYSYNNDPISDNSTNEVVMTPSSNGRQSIDPMREIRPQFLGKRYLEQLANARQNAAEITDSKTKSRSTVKQQLYRLNTNLSLKKLLPLPAGKSKLSAFMKMADRMYEEMSVDGDLDDITWLYDPLADLKASGLAMIDYASPFISDGLLRTTDPIDIKDEVSSFSIGPNLSLENNESKGVLKSDSDNCSLSIQHSSTKLQELKNGSSRTYLQSTSCNQGVSNKTSSFNYLPVTPPPTADTKPCDNVSEDHHDCCDSVAYGQISLAQRDFTVTNDVTMGMFPSEITLPMGKEDDYQSIDSALGEETSATSLVKDDVERETMSCTENNIHLNAPQQGLEVLKSLSSTSIDKNEVSYSSLSTVFSNVQHFEQLAKDGTENPLNLRKSESRKFPIKTTVCEAIRERARAFENIDDCRPPSCGEQPMHRVEVDDSFDTVNIRNQVAMFEKLFGANTYV